MSRSSSDHERRNGDGDGTDADADSTGTGASAPVLPYRQSREREEALLRLAEREGGPAGDLARSVLVRHYGYEEEDFS